MTREKVLATLFWGSISVSAAMLVDYLITIQLLHDWQAYTPLVTFSIATIVTLPTTYALVNGRINLRNAGEALSAARDAALQADQAKSQFFANMSHELRTPLNAILGFSELLQMEGFSERRIEYARIVHSSGQHLLLLVDDLLDLSRIEAGKLELRDEVFELDTMIEECVRTVEPRASTAGLQLVRTIDANLPGITADRRALKQILLNLLTNAIKFTNPGGKVEVFAGMASTGELCFGVNDDGVGIAEEDQAHVFERFGQARHDIVSPEKGTGLGLPIVKGLVEAHGGRVGMDSHLGRGTRLSVWLPKERVKSRSPIAMAS